MTRQLDSDLMMRLANADTNALAVIFERYWSSVVRYAICLLKSQDEAEDVAQETFERLWERRDAWRVAGSVQPLLIQIARNLCIDVLRRRATGERAALHAVRPVAVPTPSRDCEEEELRTIVTRAVLALPERRREVLILSRIHGLSRQEISEILEIAPRTVANHLRLALADLRRLLVPYLHEQLGDQKYSRTDIADEV
jgi:RNA polymerase sigma-70 factor (family 1)